MPEDKKILILEAAMKIFAEKGFANATISEIAEIAGIGKGSIYGYFKSKNELLEESFLYYIDRLAKETEAMPETTNSIEKLSLLISSSLKSLEDFEELLPIIFEFWGASFHEPSSRIFHLVHEMYNSFISIIEEIIKNGQRKNEINNNVDPKYFSMMLFCILDESFIHKIFSKSIFDIKKMEKECIKMIEIYLKK